VRRIGAAMAGVALLVISCGGGGTSTTTPVPSSAPPTSASPTTVVTSLVSTTAPTATSPTTSPPTTVAAPPSSSTTTTSTPPARTGTLVSIPVGEGGIEYRGSGDEQEITGPSLMAVDPGGGIQIHDPVGGRILSFRDDARTSIDLGDIDILAVTALAAGPDQLLLVEILFQPVRHRVHWVGYDGSLIDTVELPEGFRLEDGLSGVRSSSAGVVLELGGGAEFGIWDGDGFIRSDQLVEDGHTVVARPPGLEVDGRLITADLSSGLGGLRYLAGDTDGGFFVVREDVLAVDPAIDVLTTVESYLSEGTLQSAAVIPSLTEQHISSPPAVAVLPDGTPIALVALETEVRIVVLELQPGRLAD